MTPSREPPTRSRAKARWISAVTSGVIVLAYAGLFRAAFTAPWFEAAGGVVSLSFVISVPFACGALCVALGRWAGSDNWAYQAVVLPALLMFFGVLLCLVLAIEALICVIMALPLLLGASVVGGLVAHALLPRNRPPPGVQVTFALFIPVLAAWAEGALHWPNETKAITNTIEIAAPAGRIWEEIASVRAIERHELPGSWIYAIGFPRPIAATLDREGTGGTRIATFERDVSFFEEVTVWDKPRTLAFTIHADPDFIPRSAFDRHIIVGGRFYDVLDGVYEIEPLGEDRCQLHLTSRHRLGTRFNRYAAWWSVRIMDGIQGTILEVIRGRAEG